MPSPSTSSRRADADERTFRLASSRLVVGIVGLTIPATVFLMTLVLNQIMQSAVTIRRSELLNGLTIAMIGSGLLSIPCTPAAIVMTIRNHARLTPGARLVAYLCGGIALLPAALVVAFFYGISQIR